MKEQGIHNEPRLGNFLPLRHADNGYGSDCQDRSNHPIVTHRAVWAARMQLETSKNLVILAGS